MGHENLKAEDTRPTKSQDSSTVAVAFKIKKTLQSTNSGKNLLAIKNQTASGGMPRMQGSPLSPNEITLSWKQGQTIRARAIGKHFSSTSP